MNEILSMLFFSISLIIRVIRVIRLIRDLALYSQFPKLIVVPGGVSD
jgi:hypothetical protein